ncbi:MAG: alpha/beta fold hydrolase [Arachnia sp.]
MRLHWDAHNPNASDAPILLVGPSLGGNAAQQWTGVAQKLENRALVVFLDLPGHVQSEPWPDETEPTLDAVASAIIAVLREVRATYGDRPAVFAGVSLSGATALHVARDFPDELSGVVVIASAATIGEPTAWLERAELVASGGTAQLVDITMKRWFTPTFRAQRRELVEGILDDLAATDDHSYAQLCRALSVHDVREDLDQIRIPTMLIAGGHDTSTPMDRVELVAERVPGAELHVIDGVAHQITVAEPGDVAVLLQNFLERVTRPDNRWQGDD